MSLPDLKFPESATWRALCLLTAFLLPLAASGQQSAVPNAIQLDEETEEIREYHVEVIVFEYAGAAAASEEDFSPPPAPDLFTEDNVFVTTEEADSLPSDAVSIEVPAPEPEPVVEEFVLLPGETLEEIPTLEAGGFRLLTNEEFRMQDAFEKLVELDAYRPLMHSAWVQPAPEKDLAMTLSLRRIGSPPLRLFGDITLYSSRFLHLVMDLSLEDPARTIKTPGLVPYYGDKPTSGSVDYRGAYDAGKTTYRIEEDRIFRNEETRYYDHPKFGVIAQIVRIEDEEDDALDTTGDLLPGVN